ncbi:HAD hydrolase-like protein [Eubacterium pyruvativorans]|uniref:HAD hydrolase-like protein n=1 Tax=Eubacterium pyruvativorans TaxID=155865 RepID=UPI003F8881C1
MKHYPYIFWDLDGTIINSYNGVAKSVQKGLGSQGVTVDWENRDQMLKYIGPPLRVSFTGFAGLTPEQAEKAVAAYRDYYIPDGMFDCTPFPGIREALGRSREAGRKNLLASSKPEFMCHQILDRFDLSAPFDEIVGATPDGRIDTKLQVLEEVFRRLREQNPDFRLSDCVLIGDTKYDAGGAAEAGIDCIGVSYGFGTEEELRDAGALAIFDTLPALCSALGI